MSTPHDHQDWSIVTSIAALAVSAIGLVGNLVYTRRKFRQSSDPELHCQTFMGGSKYGSLHARLQNLDSSLTVSDITVFLALRAHPDRFSLRGRAWARCFQQAIDPIPPLQAAEVLYSRERSLSCAVHERFPGYLKEVHIEGAKPWNDEMSFYHREIRHKKWDIRLQIQFRGAIHGGRKLTKVVRLTIEPECKSYTLNVKADGEITQRTGIFVGGWKIV